MTFNTNYRLNRHHKFKQGSRKYIADLENNGIIQINDVEWDILGRYADQTQYEIVEALKGKYKVNSIFDGIARLQQLARQGELLTQISHSASKSHPLQQIENQLKVLVPFDFTREKLSLDYIVHMNRYQLLTSVAESVELEALGFSRIGKDNIQTRSMENLGKLRIRKIDVAEGNTFTPAWYARNGYDGVLLMSQFLTDNLLYYHIPDVPIVHCIESTQNLQNSTLETLLNLHAFQKVSDTLVVKASWMEEWLSEFGIAEKNIQMIPDGINVVKSIDKALAKKHTANIFDKPMFTQRPVVGLISGFEPNQGAQWITEFAEVNPHLAIFVYDSVLADHYKNPPDNVVMFRADDQEMSTILPVFFQALDLVCFPAIPGTPASVVLEAIAYGTPCIAMTKYGLPPEVSGTGVSVESEWDNFGNFYVPMHELSATINQWLMPSNMRAASEKIAKKLSQKYTWERTSAEITQLFRDKSSLKTGNYQACKSLFPPIFCRRYDPQTRQTTSDAYRLGINRYETLDKALAEVLVEHHKTAEVESVFKHFKTTVPLSTARQFHEKDKSQDYVCDSSNGIRGERSRSQKSIVSSHGNPGVKDTSTKADVQTGVA